MTTATPCIMTQQQQVKFDQSLGSALSWIKVVQERLRQNDNTQGPREDLEARVRATEEICECEEEGRMKVDLVMATAESLLRTISEEDRVHICTKLKELKALWEETSTYITHCHSRVEWVWLHWGEYLKAYEELWAWLLRTRQILAPEPELQLGSQEKLWQLEHHRVLLEDTQHHAAHLGRLLEEAEVLHVRTQDESVGPEARRDLEGAYNKVLEQAKERVSLLERIVEEQRAYDNLVEDFRSWLASQTQIVNQALDAEDLADNNMETLQELYDTVSSREGSLSRIESVAIGVKHSSSPGGAERISQETEALRGAWERLRERLAAEREALRERRQSQEARVSLTNQLEEEVARLHAQTQRFSRQLEGDSEDGREQDALDAWRTSTDILSAMATEEPSVEQLKAELKKLLRYSHDATSLSDRLLGCIKEFQGVKSRAFRLCAEREASLTNRLWDLLQDHSRWNQMATKMLGVPLESIESRHIAPVLENVEKLLQHRHGLEERQRTMPLREDSLHCGHGSEKARSLLKELSLAFGKREELYEKLQQRKVHLQGMLSNVDQFDKGYESILKHLDSLRQKLTSVGTLQPDLQAKRNQNDQLKVILAELEAIPADFTSLQVLVSDNLSNMKRFNFLHAEWKNMLSGAKVKLKESTQNVAEHDEFGRSLLDLESWLKAMQERLAASGAVSGDGGPVDVQTDIQFEDLLEKEIQLHQIEVLGQRVMARTSKEGQEQIPLVLLRLRESWNSVHNLCTQRQIHLLLAERDHTHSKERMETADGLPLGDVSGSSLSHRIKPTGETERRSSNTVLSFEGQLASDAGGSGKGSGRGQGEGGSGKHREVFEAWLKRGNVELSKLSSYKAPLSRKELQAQQQKLQELRADLGQGHDLFQRMISAGTEGQALEDLRYHWMLYRTKLHDCGDPQAHPELKASRVPKQKLTVTEMRTAQKSSSGFLQRVCCAALPLQLLLLSLLLLAFLLPLTYEGNSCSLVNNFARSFKVMLRHDGLPPT
ncbi:nesprin-3-like isoform X1 [Alosa sapidissima]|uniref:nesprin-3-like isoform X1 n=2 Tax=Alosa sapidissima TaxID=34773 RepID=UPI001C08510F|nr:nesprin-3-like isoform X1 [Alosa sapidissima]